MPEFYLNEPNYDPPPIDSLWRDWWSNIPDQKIGRVIAAEHQYLHFQMHLLRNMHFRTATVSGSLDRSLRSGAIKAAQLMCASILEAAFRAHAEARAWGRLTQHPPQRRTFGKVVEAWSKRGWPDLASVKDDIIWFKAARDNIHLFRYKPAGRSSTTALREEADLIQRGTRSLVAVSQLTSA